MYYSAIFHPVPGFPGYLVNRHGTVLNPNGKECQWHKQKTVSLKKDGKQVIKSPFTLYTWAIDAITLPPVHCGLCGSVIPPKAHSSVIPAKAGIQSPAVIAELETQLSQAQNRISSLEQALHLAQTLVAKTLRQRDTLAAKLLLEV